MGSSISFSPKKNEKTQRIVAVAQNPTKVNQIFDEIATYSHNNLNIKHNRLGKENDTLCLTEILLYIGKRFNIFFNENFYVESLILKETFYFCLGSKSNSSSDKKTSIKRATQGDLNRRKFENFIPVLFLFSHIWEIFLACNDSVEDDYIFLKEFLRAQILFQNLEEVSMTYISENRWKQEFNIINKEKNGSISFPEVVEYWVNKIITPEIYFVKALQISRTRWKRTIVNGELINLTSGTIGTINNTSTEEIKKEDKAILRSLSVDDSLDDESDDYVLVPKPKCEYPQSDKPDSSPVIQVKGKKKNKNDVKKTNNIFSTSVKFLNKEFSKSDLLKMSILSPPRVNWHTLNKKREVIVLPTNTTHHAVFCTEEVVTSKASEEPILLTSKIGGDALQKPSAGKESSATKQYWRRDYDNTNEVWKPRYKLSKRSKKFTTIKTEMI